MFVLLSGLLAATASSLLVYRAFGRPRRQTGSAALRLLPLTPWSALGSGRRVARFLFDTTDPTLVLTSLSARAEAFGLDALPRPALRISVRIGFGDDLPRQAVRDLKGTELLVELNLAGDPGDRRALHAATIDLSWRTYGRNGTQDGGTTLVVPLGQAAEPVLPQSCGDGTVLPLPTRLVVPGDDLAAILAGAVVGRVRPDDCLAVSESALAISEGRLTWPHWDQTPTRWAFGLCRLFPTASSLATPHGMQAAIDEAGLPRLLLALGLGAIGKLLGRRGLFYRVAGRRVALIDDVGGTLPPFDRAIVLAPLTAARFAADLARRCAAQVAVVDANPFGVRVLAATPGVDHDRLRRALASNPHGNGMERTPLVRVRFSQSPAELPALQREGASW